MAKVIIGSANNDKEENAIPPKITNNIKLFFIDLKLFAMPIHTRKSADFAIAHLRVRTLALAPQVK